MFVSTGYKLIQYHHITRSPSAVIAAGTIENANERGEHIKASEIHHCSDSAKQYVGFLFLWFKLINSHNFLFTYFFSQFLHLNFAILFCLLVCGVSCFQLHSLVWGSLHLPNYHILHIFVNCLFCHHYLQMSMLINACVSIAYQAFQKKSGTWLIIT